MNASAPAEVRGMSDDRKLVYSTDGGWQGPQPKPPPRKTGAQKNPLPDDGVIRIVRENRRGGVMSVVFGLDEREVGEVAKTLKKLCGTGGTAKNGVVEIQGDHREKILAHFERAGRKVKKAGG